MEIKRDLYLKKLIDRQHNGMIKVITGMRRSAWLACKYLHDFKVNKRTFKGNYQVCVVSVSNESH